MKILKKALSLLISLAVLANIGVCSFAEIGADNVTVIFNIDGENFTYGIKEEKDALFKAEKLSGNSCRLLFENIDADISTISVIEIIPADTGKLEPETQAYGDAVPFQLFCGLRTNAATVCDGKNYTETPIKKSYYILNGKRAVEIVFENITDERLMKALTEYDAMGVYFLGSGYIAPDGEKTMGNIPLVRKDEGKIVIEEEGNILLDSYYGSPYHREIFTDEETVVRTKRTGKTSAVLRIENINLDLAEIGAVGMVPVYTEKMPKLMELFCGACPFMFYFNFVDGNYFCQSGFDVDDNYKSDGIFTRTGGVYSLEFRFANLTEEELKALVETDGMTLFFYGYENGQMFLPSGKAAGAYASLIKKTEYPALTDETADVNGDGKANSLDALFILNVLVSGIEPDISLDADKNGEVNALDAMLILQYAAGI